MAMPGMISDLTGCPPLSADEHAHIKPPPNVRRGPVILTIASDVMVYPQLLGPPTDTPNRLPIYGAQKREKSNSCAMAAQHGRGNTGR